MNLTSQFNKKTNITFPFNLKVEESVKEANDKEWYRKYSEYIAPSSLNTIEDFEELKTNYEVLNNNLEKFKERLQRFCNPMGEDIGQLEEEVIPFEKLNNKVNVLLGELLKRSDNHKVLLLSAKAVQQKNEALISAIKESVEEKVRLEIEKQEMYLQGKPKEEVDQYVQELRTKLEPQDILNKNWQSEWEIFYNKALQYCNIYENVKSKRLETFKDVIAADRMFVYSGWKNGKPYLEVRNPLYTGFHKAPNEINISKSSYVFYKKPITLAEALDTYGEDLKDEEIDKLLVTSGYASVDKRHSLGTADSQTVLNRKWHDWAETIDNKTNKLVGTHQGQAHIRKNAVYDLIWETHIEFKAYRKVIFLTYLDEYSEKVTVITSTDFKIPSDAQKIKFTNRYGQSSTKHVWIDSLMQKEYEAEIIWIPRKYEVVRLGYDVYPIMREVPYQNTNIESPYSSFNLSTFGGIFTSRNAKSTPLLTRAIPSYFQYIYIKHIQNRELAKYQGAIQSIDVDQIPDELGKDIYGEPLRDKVSTYLLYLKRTNKDFYSGSQNSLGGLPPSTRSPGSSGYMLGTAVELMNLQNLLEYIDREIGLSMGISPQREAAFSANSNVTDNQQALVQSSHITEPYFYLHNEYWKTALNDYIINFRTYCQKELEDGRKAIFNYILPDGTTELFNVSDNMLQHTDIGLYVSNSGQEQKYLDSMEHLALTFAQNSGEGIEVISTLLKSITQGASPEEVHKMIQVELEKQRKRQEAMQTQQLQSQEKIVQMQTTLREDVQAHELDKIDRKGEWDVKKAQIITYLGMDDKDLDDDGQLDIVELAQNEKIESRKLDLKDKELSMKDKQHYDKLEVEKEKIKAMKSKKTSK